MWGGTLLTLLSLVTGFYLLFTDQDDAAKPWLALVPIGASAQTEGDVSRAEDQVERAKEATSAAYAKWKAAQDELEAALRRLSLWSEAVHRDTGPSAASLLDEVRGALADDLDAPRALRLVDRWAERVRRGHGDDPSAPDLVADMSDALLGVDLRAATVSRPDRGA